MTKQEFTDHLNHSGGKKFKPANAHQAAEAEGSFPCYIATGEHIYLGHYHEGKWYRHGFEYVKDKHGYAVKPKQQIQTEEEISDAEWYYKIK